MKCKLKENFDDLLYLPLAQWVKEVKAIQKRHGFIKLSGEKTEDNEYRIAGYNYLLSENWIDILEEE